MQNVMILTVWRTTDLRHRGRQVWQHAPLEREKMARWFDKGSVPGGYHTETSNETWWLDHLLAEPGISSVSATNRTYCSRTADIQMQQNAKQN